MLKKTISYEDYNGANRNEDFYFNLSKAEVMEMEMGIEGGLTEKIDRITKTKNVPELSKLFKELILRSYGEKTPDGRRLRKKDDNGRPLSAAFEETEAYSVLFMELLTDAEKAADFVNGITPNVEGKEEAIAKAKDEYLASVEANNN